MVAESAVTGRAGVGGGGHRAGILSASRISLEMLTATLENGGLDVLVAEEAGLPSLCV